MLCLRKTGMAIGSAKDAITVIFATASEGNSASCYWGGHLRHLVAKVSTMNEPLVRRLASVTILNMRDEHRFKCWCIDREIDQRTLSPSQREEKIREWKMSQAQ